MVEAYKWDGSAEMQEAIGHWFKADFIVRDDMWVVRDERGKVSFMDDEEFHATFEPTDRESAEAMGLENDVQKVWG